MFENICILRLSAIGDVVNCLPALRAIQKTYPDAKITWIIGEIEYQIVKDIENITWQIVDKNKILKSWCQLKKLPKFDVVLHMQNAFRASILVTALKSPLKIGFDYNRSRDLQKLFCNQQVKARDYAHTLENHLDFAIKIGTNCKQLIWQLPLDKMVTETKHIKLPDNYVVICPCASNPVRNWSVYYYIEIIQQITQQYKIACVLVGDNTDLEKQYAHEIKNTTSKTINLIGQTSIRQMVAIISKSKLLIAPDTGPTHIAVATNTRVIGLYASSNPKRTGPYLFNELIVNQYPQAVKKYLNKTSDQIKFGTRVRHPGVMQLITPEMVMEKVIKALS